jgi:hypothetical protein
MTIQDFWNQAFLAALSRLPAEEASAEAEKATRICIERWSQTKNGPTVYKPVLTPLELVDVSNEMAFRFWNAPPVV